MIERQVAAYTVRAGVFQGMLAQAHKSRNALEKARQQSLGGARAQLGRQSPWSRASCSRTVSAICD